MRKHKERLPLRGVNKGFERAAGCGGLDKMGYRFNFTWPEKVKLMICREMEEASIASRV